MSYTRTTVIDPNPGGSTRKQAILDLDTDLTGSFTNLNTHEALTTGAHGVGAGTICGTTLTQTLTNKTISGGTITGATIGDATLTGTLTASSATITGATLANPTITGTLSNPTLTGGSSTNMTITTPTLTGTVTASGATITGGTAVNMTIQAPTLTGTVTASGATITGATIFNPTITGTLKLGTTSMTANHKAFVNAAGTAGEWASGMHLGALTRAFDGATADVAYTGVGFKPSLVIFLASLPAANNYLSIGFDNGSSPSCVYNNGNVTAGNWPRGSYGVVMIYTGGNLMTGTIKTLDADGFTMTWTKTGSPGSGTVYVEYIAFR